MSETGSSYRHHVFIVTSRERDIASMRAEFALRSRLRSALVAHGLDIEVRISVCEPTDDPEVRLVVFPGGVSYRVPDVAAVDRVVEEHLLGGVAVEEFVVRRESRQCVFICSLDSPSCGALGSPRTLDEVRELTRAAGSDAVILATNCLGRCAYSPNWVVYPEGVWYSEVSASVAPKIVSGHILGGEVQEDYVSLRFEPSADASGATSES